MMAVGDPFMVPIALFFSIAVMVVGLPIARAIGRRMESGASRPSVPADVSARLERMEQSIDAIAVEVERISEGQRFTTRLLSERAGGERPPVGDRGPSAP